MSRMSFSLRTGSLMTRLAQEQTGETGCHPHSVHPLVSRKPSLAQDPQTKGKKKSKTSKEYKCNNVLIFGSWSTQEKPEPGRLRLRGHRLEFE